MFKALEGLNYAKRAPTWIFLNKNSGILFVLDFRANLIKNLLKINNLRIKL